LTLFRLDAPGFEAFVGQGPALAERYRIQGLPTLILFQGGAEVQRRVGLMDRAAVHALLKEALRA